MKKFLLIAALAATNIAAHADVFVAGKAQIANGLEWQGSNSTNKMTSWGDNQYTLTVKANISSDNASDLEYKIVNGANWYPKSNGNNDAPGGTSTTNSRLSINGTGDYTIIYYYTTNDNNKHGALAYNANTPLHIKHSWDGGDNWYYKDLNYDKNSGIFYIINTWRNNGVNLNKTQYDEYDYENWRNSTSATVFIPKKAITKVPDNLSSGTESIFMLDEDGKVTVEKVADCTLSDEIVGSEQTMTTSDKIKYTYTVSNVYIAAGTNDFQIAQNGESYNGTVEGVETNGFYKVTYTYNQLSKQVNAQAEKVSTEAAIKHNWYGQNDFTWKPLEQVTAEKTLYKYYVKALFGGNSVTVYDGDTNETKTYTIKTTSNNTPSKVKALEEATGDILVIGDMPKEGDLCLFYYKNLKESVTTNNKTETINLLPVAIEKTTEDAVVTAIDDVKVADSKSNKATKVIENGQLVIIRDGIRYNVMGQKL